jgi:hypothetical protein
VRPTAILTLRQSALKHIFARLTYPATSCDDASFGCGCARQLSSHDRGALTNCACLNPAINEANARHHQGAASVAFVFGAVNMSAVQRLVWPRRRRHASARVAARIGSKPKVAQTSSNAPQSSILPVCRVWFRPRCRSPRIRASAGQHIRILQRFAQHNERPRWSTKSVILF